MIPVDPISLQRIQLLHPRLRKEAEEILRACYQRGVPIRFTHTLRTFTEQNQLYAQGRTAPGTIVTNAQGGYSWHNYGLAIDFCLLVNGRTASWDTVRDGDRDRTADWMEVVAEFKKRGWEWGGDWTRFKDMPHFEKTFNLTINDALRRHKGRDFVSGNYIRI